MTHHALRAALVAAISSLAACTGYGTDDPSAGELDDRPVADTFTSSSLQLVAGSRFRVEVDPRPPKKDKVDKSTGARFAGTVTGVGVVALSPGGRAVDVYEASDWSPPGEDDKKYRGSLPVPPPRRDHARFAPAVVVRAAGDRRVVRYDPSGAKALRDLFLPVTWLHAEKAAEEVDEVALHVTLKVDAKPQVGDWAVKSFARLRAGAVPVNEIGDPVGPFVAGTHLSDTLPTAASGGEIEARIPRHGYGDAQAIAPALLAAGELDDASKGEAEDPWEALVYAPDGAAALTLHEPGWGTSAGRLTYGFYGGVVVSQRDAYDFSEFDPYVRFVADSTFEGDFEHEENANYFDWDDIHTTVDVALTAIPISDPAAGGTTSGGGTTDFQGSAKAITAQIGGDWRLFQTDVQDDSYLTFGFTARAGFDTVLEEEALGNGEESVAEFWNVGVKFAGISARSTGSVNNPLPTHYATFTYGQHDLLVPDTGLAGREKHRLFFETAIVLNRASGFYVGLSGNLGQGPDDVRLLVGFAGTLGGLLRNLQAIVPTGLQR